MEAWGGATYDVALRFLHEDPWDRLAALREAVPNICLQMLLRGRNTVGYTPYPEAVTDAFVRGGGDAPASTSSGSSTRSTTSSQMRPAIDAVRETGTAVAEVALCYTGDLSDPAEKLYTLDYYLRLAEQIVDAGAHVLAIKDMAGLLRPPAAATLVTALRERFDLPVHLHTHDTAGGQLATLLAAWQAGVDAVDGASPRMAGTTQPAAAVGASSPPPTTPSGPPAWTCAAVNDLEPYWEAVRRVYAPFESGLPAPDRPRLHPRDPRRAAVQPAPAGHRARAGAAVRGGRGRLRRRRPAARPAGQGHPVVQGRRRPRAAAGRRRRRPVEDFAADPGKFDLPDSVIGFLRGELGDPPGGWPEPFRTKALEGRRPAEPPAELRRRGPARAGRGSRGATLNRLLFPGPTKEFRRAPRAPTATSRCCPPRSSSTGCGPGVEHAVDLEPGVRLLIGVEADRRRRRARHAHRHVHAQRPAAAGARCATARSTPTSRPPRRPTAATPATSPRRSPAWSPCRSPRATASRPAQPIATIEAMKMEAAITAPRSPAPSSGLAIGPVQQVEGGDLAGRRALVS